MSMEKLVLRKKYSICFIGGKWKREGKKDSCLVTIARRDVALLRGKEV